MAKNVWLSTQQLCEFFFYFKRIAKAQVKKWSIATETLWLAWKQTIDIWFGLGIKTYLVRLKKWLTMAKLCVCVCVWPSAQPQPPLRFALFCFWLYELHLFKSSATDMEGVTCQLNPCASPPDAKGCTFYVWMGHRGTWQLARWEREPFGKCVGK